MGLDLRGWLEIKQNREWLAAGSHDIPRNYALYAALFARRNSWRLRPLQYVDGTPPGLSVDAEPDFFEGGDPWGDHCWLSGAEILRAGWRETMTWPRDRIEIYFVDADGERLIRGRDSSYPALLTDDEVLVLLDRREYTKRNWYYKAIDDALCFEVEEEWLRVVSRIEALTDEGVESRFVGCFS